QSIHRGFDVHTKSGALTVPTTVHEALCLP
ncbi:hypothetical protein D049_1859B, partial [Vibrio parahaemolyticus VPTS-2010]